LTATVTSVIASPATGDEGLGQRISITLTMSQSVSVDGPPELILNDGGVATYDVSKSMPNSLVFDYTVVGGQSTPNLAVTGTVLNGASILDSSNTDADLSGAVKTFSGLQIDGTGSVFACVAQNATGTSQTLFVQDYNPNFEPVGDAIPIATSSSSPSSLFGSPVFSPVNVSFNPNGSLTLSRFQISKTIAKALPTTKR
jgi:hypothetical protein